jgi:hypothetical protein
MQLCTKKPWVVIDDEIGDHVIRNLKPTYPNLPITPMRYWGVWVDIFQIADYMVSDFRRLCAPGIYLWLSL